MKVTNPGKNAFDCIFSLITTYFRLRDIAPRALVQIGQLDRIINEYLSKVMYST